MVYSECVLKVGDSGQLRGREGGREGRRGGGGEGEGEREANAQFYENRVT